MASYRVSRVALDDVKPELLRIWNRNLTVVGTVDDRFRWTYQLAPDAWHDIFMLSAEDPRGPQLVGTAGLEVRAFASPDRELRVALGCNLAVDAAHRTLMPGLRLVRAIRRDTPAEFDLAYHIPNELAQPLYARAGYRDLGEMIRYVRVLRHTPYVRQKIDVPYLAAVVGSVVDAAAAFRHASRRRAARERALLWLGAFDRRFDALWIRAHSTFPIVARRDAAWLSWRFSCPGSRARIAALVDRSSPSTVCGYAIVEQLDSVAHVRDLFGPLDELDALLALLSPALRDHGATSASFRYLGSHDVIALLRAHGYRARDAKRRVCVELGAGLADSERAIATTPEAWHLTEYDEDS